MPLANPLCGPGLGKGDRLAVLAYNRVEWLEISAATATAGIVLVPINSRETGRRLRACLLEAPARVLHGEIVSLPVLKPHQVPAWYRLLTESRAPACDPAQPGAQEERAVPAPLQPPTRGEVHVWAVALDTVSTAGIALPLDEREQADAARFATPLLTHRCLVSRWMRRSVLARYLAIAPERISYRTTRHGRPELAAGGCDLRFSATDSGRLALLAVTVDAALGIDLELYRDFADRSEIVRRWFHPSERAQVFARETAAEQADVFFRLWTLKEAFVKALGLGLQLPLDSFEIDAGANGSCPRLIVQPARAEVGPHARWSLADLSHPPHAYVSIALARPIESLTMWSWRP